MYKLLLATDDPQIKKMAEESVDWHALGYHRPVITSDCAQTVEALKTKVVDAIGFRLNKADHEQLDRYLRYGRPSLPVFNVASDAEAQSRIMKELITVMDRLHAQDADDYYDGEDMLNAVRDDFVHQLLAGRVTDPSRAERTLAYLRSRIDPSQKFVLFEIDLPQGEIYMSGYYDPALRQSRLESALRNNFFGRYVNGIYYAVAVLTPRHIRLVAAPMEGTSVTEEELVSAARAHVEATFDKVKEYLELDMYIRDMRILENMQALLG